MQSINFQIAVILQSSQPCSILFTTDNAHKHMDSFVAVQLQHFEIDKDFVV